MKVIKEDDSSYAQLQKKYSVLKKEILIGIGVVIVLIIAGGIAVFNPFEGNDSAGTSADGKGKIAYEKEAFASEGIVCNPPYIRHENGCCLDRDGNNFCDPDEGGVIEVISPPVAGVSPSGTVLPAETEPLMVEGKLVCNSPYIRHGWDCCLDQNENAVCDGDETGEEPAVENAPEEGAVGEAPVEEPAAAEVTTEEAVVEETMAEETTAEEAPGEPLTPATEYSTSVSCYDGLDNDRDTLIDGLDGDCRGRVCAINQPLRYWTWSDLTVGDRRIGCCQSTQCVAPDRRCAAFGSTSSNGELICGDVNQWDGCLSINTGEISDDGNSHCAAANQDASSQWTITRSTETGYCRDNIDNDNDNLIDELDRNCVGDESKGSYLIWSFRAIKSSPSDEWVYHPDEDRSGLITTGGPAPAADASGRRRIRYCSSAFDCVTIGGECAHVGEARGVWLCAALRPENFWYRCTEKELGSEVTWGLIWRSVCRRSSDGLLEWWSEPTS